MLATTMLEVTEMIIKHHKRIKKNTQNMKNMSEK